MDPETPLEKLDDRRVVQLQCGARHGPAVKAVFTLERSCPNLSVAPVWAIVRMVAGVVLKRRTTRPRWGGWMSFATRAGPC
jgi:hypothetical protein